MSKFDRMQSFIHVVEENSFALAAKKLNITTAAISKQISALEKELGVQLISRTTRSLSLTEIGSLYYFESKNLMEKANQIESLISQQALQPKGHLKIVSARHYGEEFIIPYLKEFLNKYPQITINLELAERMPDVKKEKVDILIGMSLSGPNDYIQKTIGTTRYKLCASLEYLKEFGIPKKPSDLSKHRYINHSIRYPVNVITLKNNKQIFINPYLVLNDTRSMLNSAINGMGIVKLHDYVVEKALSENKLVEILSDYLEPKISIYLCYPQSRYLHPKIRAFIDFFSNN